jgi:AcrR family transcriptional regulator
MNNVQQLFVMSYRRNKDQKIADIKKGFTEVINQQGYDKTTIRQIAEKAETSVGIIYRYFPEGKPSIAASIYEDNLRGTLLPYGFQEGYESVEEQLQSHLNTHRENVELYKAFDQAILANHDVFVSIKRDRKEIMREYATKKGFLEENVDQWLINYNVIDAVIHRHLYIDTICDSDDKLINILHSIYDAVTNSCNIITSTA